MVGRGETLSVVARRFYGDPKAFDRLYLANAAEIGDDPARVEIGTVLHVPCPDDIRTAGTPTPGVAATPVAASAAAPVGPEWQVLIGVPELMAFSPGSGVQIVDIRGDGAAPGFVPGSMPIPYEKWRRAADPGPDATALSRLIGASGLDLGQPIVLVHDRLDAASIDRAAWVYWLLKMAGARQVAILEPGFEGWSAAGLRPTRLTQPVMPRRVAVELDPRWRGGAEEAARIAAGGARGTMLEGRPDAFIEAGWGVRDAGTSTAQRRAEQVLDYLKMQPIAWEAAPVAVVGWQGLSGAAVWFYASEVAGIRNVWLAVPG